MRIPTVLIGCVVLVSLGCAGTFTSTPPAPMPAGPTTELVPLKIAFEETFPDAEGAKRVAVCQLRDERTGAGYVGEGPVTADRAAVSKYVMKDDPTLVLPRVLAKELKTVGLNVTPAERLSDPVGGEPVREILKRCGADYLIAGRLEEISVRARGDEGRPVFVTVSIRFDIYNKDGQLRMYYPARRSDADFLGEKSSDPAEVNALLERTVNALIASVVDDPYLEKALDLDPETVKQMRSGKPLPTAGPAETTPETKPEEPKTDANPAPPTDADKKKADDAKDLDEAVKDAPK